MNPRDDRFPLFPLAVLKGTIEHDDGTAYFGSLMGYRFYRNEAFRHGWITYPAVSDSTSKLVATARGRELYVLLRLDTLPNQQGSRAYMWKWDDARTLYQLYSVKPAL